LKHFYIKRPGVVSHYIKWIEFVQDRTVRGYAYFKMTMTRTLLNKVFYIKWSG
jgi:hypothetical protein